MSSALADTELLITRTFDAPAQLVFSMWSDPEHMKQWIGPHGFECRSAEIDFRVGGRYRAMIWSADQGESWFGGIYREIEPNRRLVFTFAWDDGPSAAVETLVTIELEEVAGRTLQRFHQVGFLDVERRDSHVGGWTEAFERQQSYVAALSKEQTQ